MYFLDFSKIVLMSLASLLALGYVYVRGGGRGGWGGEFDDLVSSQVLFVSM